MHSKRNEAAGFTLAEILVVMAILVLLGWLVYPSYLESIRKARRGEARAALIVLMQQQERYYSRHNSYLAFSSDSADQQERKFKWYTGDSPERSAYEIRAEACADDSIADCVRLVAVPGTARVDSHYADPACGTLALRSDGTREANRPECWR
jgi:type IV pilus assembly protein PilE